MVAARRAYFDIDELTVLRGIRGQFFIINRWSSFFELMCRVCGYNLCDNK